MFRKEDIVARLKAGETPEAIAEEMTVALNDASAALKAEEADKEKLEFGYKFLEMIRTYLITYHSKASITEDVLNEPITDEAVERFMATANDIVVGYEKMIATFSAMGDLLTPANFGRQIKETPKDPLAKFLSDHNL